MPGLITRMLLLLFVAIVASGCDERVLLATVASEKEANLIMVELADREEIYTAGKKPHKQQRETAWNIVVEPQDLITARRLLVMLDLPSDKRAGLEQVFAQSGLIPTKTDERAKLMYAIAGELETTLEVYDTVVRARVHVNLPENNPLNTSGEGDRASPSASVVIKYLPRGAGDDAHKPMPPDNSSDNRVEPPIEIVQHLVADSIEGLDADRVSVAYTAAGSGSLGSKKGERHPGYVPRRRPTRNEGILGGAVIVEAAGLIWLLLLLRQHVAKPKAEMGGATT